MSALCPSQRRSDTPVFFQVFDTNCFQNLRSSVPIPDGPFTEPKEDRSDTRLYSLCHIVKTNLILNILDSDSKVLC